MASLVFINDKTYANVGIRYQKPKVILRFSESGAMTLQIEIPSKEEFAKFCKRHHIRKLSIFGSALREDFGPDSDLDVLVEFKQGNKPGFFRLIEMEGELTELLNRKVDLRTPDDLSRYFREDVLANAEVLHTEK